MCDTVVALGNSTADGSVIFGKNSDREPNEAHEVVLIPAASHAAGSTVKCTYIEIPQVAQTYQVLLAKPFWIWGAEMGSNEFGVTIGNEAVFTKTPYSKQPGLIGMDFLRLALERSKTATQALDVIIDLLEQYGQGGNCGFAHPLHYHNSFLICDHEEAWVLETSGKEWAAEKVKDVRSISNAITIGEHWERCSKNLVQNAVDHGWCKSAVDFNFARCYSDTIYTTFANGRPRQVCTTQALRQKIGRITPQDVIELLRSHFGDGNPRWTPDNGVTGADVCMHAGWGPIRVSQSAGSMVTVLKKGQQPIHWVTGTAAPCLSVFKPVWLDSGLPKLSPAGGTYDDSVLYWRHEALHRAVLRDYAVRKRVFAGELADLQEELFAEVQQQTFGDKETRSAITQMAFIRVDEKEAAWLDKVRKQKVTRKNSLLFASAWRKFDREAGMPEE